MFFSPPVPSVTPKQAHEEFIAGNLVILDVREADEIAAASVSGSMFIRMSEIPSRISEIPTDKKVGVLCRSGNRSANVTRYLRQNGLNNIYNIAGGIKKWKLTVDPTLNPI